VRAALATRQVTPAVPGAAETDCDLAIPICDEDTQVALGVIALRGVSPSQMRAAELRDVGILAQWLAPVLARQLRRQLGKAISAHEELRDSEGSPR
jgi:hypothetical protein